MNERLQCSCLRNKEYFFYNEQSICYIMDSLVIIVVFFLWATGGTYYAQTTDERKCSFFFFCPKIVKKTLGALGPRIKKKTRTSPWNTTAGAVDTRRITITEYFRTSLYYINHRANGSRSGTYVDSMEFEDNIAL